MTRKELLDHILEQDKEIFSLIAKTIEVIKSHSLWGSDDSYTFKDGEVWRRFDPEYEIAKNTGTIQELFPEEVKRVLKGQDKETIEQIINTHEDKSK